MKPLITFLALSVLLAYTNVHAQIPPDIIVAADGSGNFKTVQQAVASIPKDNRQRIVILIKDGVYREKVRIDAACVTLRGQSRKGTRIEYAQLNDDFIKLPDELGRAVVNIHADDVVLESLTIANTAGVVGKHSFAVYGTGDRTVIIDCDFLNEGADTVALWNGKTGRYYHTRCSFRGSADFVCPRGWCYISDSTFYQVKVSTSVWHDGHENQDMKFVLRNCKFDGVKDWTLARHHVDAQFYFLDCTFSQTMRDRPPQRVVYPDDPKRNEQLDKNNLWGERAYFYNCHREGGDFAWHKDNLASSPGSPMPAHITAAWTFGYSWDPQRTSGPKIQRVARDKDLLVVTFNEAVTVKGSPRLVLDGGGYADYAAGSGTDTLSFICHGAGSAVVAVDLNGGCIIASQASELILHAELSVKSES